MGGKFLRGRVPKLNQNKRPLFNISGITTQMLLDFGAEADPP